MKVVETIARAAPLYDCGNIWDRMNNIKINAVEDMTPWENKVNNKSPSVMPSGIEKGPTRAHEPSMVVTGS